MLVGDDPDLENPGWRRLQIVFAVGNPGTGAHDLYVACFGTALVTQVVFVADSPFTNVGDDFHIAVRMFRETGARGDHVVVPYPQVAPVHSLRVVVFGERKVVMGVQPAVVSCAQCVERSEFKHDASPE